MHNAVVSVICVCLTLCGVSDPHVYGAILIILVLINLPTLWRTFTSFLHRRADPGLVAGMVPVNPMHAAAMSRVLMPNIYEVVDPDKTAAHYRRQTERLQALKKKLDAQTALAESIIHNQQARNRVNSDH